MSAKTAVVLLPHRFRLPCRFGLSGHATTSLTVAIGVCVVGHFPLASGNLGIFAPELCTTAKALCLTIIVIATSL